MSIVTSSQKVKQINGWSEDEQSVKSITNGLYGIKGSKISNIMEGMRQSLLASTIRTEEKMVVEDTPATEEEKASIVQDGIHCRLIYMSQFSREDNEYNNPCVVIDNEGDIEKVTTVDLIKELEKTIELHNATHDPKTHHKVRFCELIILYAINENKETTPPPSTPTEKSDEDPPTKRPKRQAAINFLTKHRKDTNKESNTKDSKDPSPVEVKVPLQSDDEGTSIPSSTIVYTSNRLRVEVNFVYPSYFKEAMSDLCISLNNLKVMTINQIPLKLDVKNSVIMYYSTKILFPDASLEKKYVNNGYIHHGKQLGSNFWMSTAREIKTYWRAYDKRINIDMLPCNSVQRISPYDTDSFVSRSLMTHLLENRPLILGKPDVEKDLIISHALLLHGNFVYIHSLYEDFFSNAIEPDIYGPETLIRKYRLQAFLELVEANTLPFDSNEEFVDIRECENVNHSLVKNTENENEKIVEKGPTLTYRCSERLERTSKYFPYMEDDTILFSSRQYDTLRALTHPIKTFITQKTITSDESEAVISCLQRLEKATRENEVKLFLNTKNSVQKRRDLYAMLWNEIAYVFKQFATVSLTHSKLNTFVTGIYAGLNDIKAASSNPLRDSMEIEQAPSKPMSIKDQLDYAANEIKSM